MAFPSYAAKRVLDDLRITSPEDLQLLDSIAWERGATVLYKPLRGAEARLAAVGRRAIITISTFVEDPHRRRFSVAHELGHLELHRRHSSVVLCTSQDIDDWEKRRTKTNLEQEANEFASALLLPERFFAPLCKDEDPSLDLVTRLADTFKVSLTAAALRYMNFCEEACAVIFSQSGYIRWFQGSKEFGDIDVFVDVRSKLDSSSLAALFFQGRIVQANPKRVRASAWLAPGRYRDDATILEQSWTMPNYDAVLTLLWIDDDLEDDEDWLLY